MPASTTPRFFIRSLGGGWFAIVDDTTGLIAKVERLRSRAETIIATLNANA